MSVYLRVSATSTDRFPWEMRYWKIQLCGDTANFPRCERYVDCVNIFFENVIGLKYDINGVIKPLSVNEIKARCLVLYEPMLTQGHFA